MSIFDRIFKKQIESAVREHLTVIELSGGGTTTYYGDRGCSNGEILSGGLGTILM